MLRHGLLDRTNTGSAVWADTAYRSRKNEAFLARNGFTSHVHRKKPASRPMPTPIRRANGPQVHRAFAHRACLRQQKDRMGLFIRTIGIARARIKIGLANLVYKSVDASRRKVILLVSVAWDARIYPIAGAIALLALMRVRYF